MGTLIDPIRIIDFYYPEDSALKQLLLKHSTQVCEKALDILKQASLSDCSVDADVVRCGAMLHDIGICRCNAPGILCMGTEPYITHGVIGAEMLREYGRNNSLDLECFARICERHTGAGITREERARQNLPIPDADYLPETAEEKLICLADKFFSKSGDLREKSIENIRHSMVKFGMASVKRFDDMLALFNCI